MQRNFREVTAPYDALEDVSSAMRRLAKSLPPSHLAEKAYALYERFRPEIPPCKKEWGASGRLDLDLIRKIASACPSGGFLILPSTDPEYLHLFLPKLH
jgi:hypothetical protein